MLPSQLALDRAHADRRAVSRDRDPQLRSPECGVPRRQARARTPRDYASLDCAVGGAASSPIPALQLLQIVRGHFAAVLLRFFLFLLRSARFEVRLLFVLAQLLKRHDLVAQFGKIGRLRSAFASEVDFTFLEKALLVAKRDARSLAPDLQPDLAKACADETHGLTLYECGL